MKCKISNEYSLSLPSLDKAEKGLVWVARFDMQCTNNVRASYVTDKVHFKIA